MADERIERARKITEPSHITTTTERGAWAVVDTIRQIIAAYDDLEHTLGINSETPAEGGWIPWSGGECPVNAYTIVDVRLRDKDLRRRKDAGEFDWDHYGIYNDIVAYRVIAYRI